MPGECVAVGSPLNGEILTLTAPVVTKPSANGNGHGPHHDAHNGHGITNGAGGLNGTRSAKGREAVAGLPKGKTPLLRIDPIGNVLLARGVLNSEQLAKAIDLQRQSGRPLGRLLVKTGMVSERELARAVAQQWGLPYVDLADRTIDPEIARLLPAYLAQRHGVIAVDHRPGRLVVAMADPANVVAIDDIRLLTGLEVEIVIAPTGDIARAHSRMLGATAEVEALVKTTPSAEADAIVDGGDEPSVERLRSMVEEAPIVRIVNEILHQAIRDGASDIHIEPRDHDMQVRFRIDGLMQDTMNAPKQIQAAIISRVKILADVDIAERRLPQDGHVHLQYDGRKFDLRVSTLPTVLGEKIVIRILGQSTTSVALDEVGLPAEVREAWEEVISRPYGMIIVTGPTGSGKTTTLYTSLARINTPERNIVSIEDPVEYRIPRVSQVQVNPKAGLTFASGLRSILRQDPDVVLIGEIRDRETAQIAVQASMTGHLVLSTLHTNDAPGAVTRLVDMGVEPFLITGSLMAVLAQRLVRKVCTHCREPYAAPLDAIRRLGLEPEQHGAVSLYRGRGCDFCHGTGYRAAGPASLA